jgi:hypothetical protein
MPDKNYIWLRFCELIAFYNLFLLEPGPYLGVICRY